MTARLVVLCFSATLKSALETALIAREETIAQLTKQIQKLEQDLVTMKGDFEFTLGGNLQSVSQLEKDIVELKHSRKREMEKYYEDREAMDNADRKKAELIQILSAEVETLKKDKIALFDDKQEAEAALKQSLEGILGENQVFTHLLISLLWLFPSGSLTTICLFCGPKKRRQKSFLRWLRGKSMPSRRRRRTWR